MQEVGYAAKGEIAAPLPFTASIISAHEELARVADRLDVLADRLCGSASTEASQRSTLSAVPVPGGIFSDMEERGNDMCAKLDRMRGYLARIERSLP